MKKIALKVIESIVLCSALICLIPLSFNIFLRLVGLLQVEFIVYRPQFMDGFIYVAICSSVAIGLAAIALEWKREKRIVSYLIYIAYLTAPFGAPLILFLITGGMLREHMEGQISIDVIHMELIFIGYVLYPIAHFIIIRLKGRIG